MNERLDDIPTTAKIMVAIVKESLSAPSKLTNIVVMGQNSLSTQHPTENRLVVIDQRTQITAKMDKHGNCQY
jgi:hypothetical protein